MAKETKIDKPDDTTESNTVVIKNKRDFMALVARIDKDDPKPEDLKALSKEMEAKPKIYRSIGNVQQKVFDQILCGAITTTSQREITKKYIAEMKAELGYQESSFVEKMLIEEIVTRWLRLASIEIAYQNVTNSSHSIEEGMYIEKRLDLAHKRFLRSMETLAKVRKLIGQTQAHGAKMFKDLMNDAR